MRASIVISLAEFCWWQYIGTTVSMEGSSIARTKNEVVTIRTTTEVKTLLKLAAERERRSSESMIEVMVLDYYARSRGLVVADLDWFHQKDST